MLLYNAIKLNRWCLDCKKESFHLKSKHILTKFIKEKKGKIIDFSDTIKNRSTFLTIKCSDFTHSSWKVRYDNLIRFKTWCPQCAGRFSPEKNIQKAKEYAKSRGGIYVSGDYKNQDSRLTFKCNNLNHKPWSSAFDKIIPLKTWCQECRIEQDKNKGLERAKQHAISKGGKCLSTSYDAQKKLLWHCGNPKHNEWFADPSNVLNLNRWCPECAGFFSAEGWLERARNYAISKGGQFLSTEHTDVHQLSTWKCSEKSHPIWQASISNIMNNNTWCAECNNSRNIKEHYTRIILE